MNRDRAVNLNKSHWNDVIAESRHLPNWGEQLLAAGQITLSTTEVAELGDIRGLRGIHMQCGTGEDTLSLCKLGAAMIGVDFSSSACSAARKLSERIGIDAHFLTLDVTASELLDAHDFDFAYTSHGVLRWLPTLKPWAENVYNSLRPGGWFYIFEVHPLVYHLVSIAGTDTLLTGDYFDQSPQEKMLEHTHLGTTSALSHRQVVHTNWTLSSIVGSLLSAGLQLVHFKEHPFTSYSRKGVLTCIEDGVWGSATPAAIPLAFSMRAQRPL